MAGDPVDWALARRVANKVAGTEPFRGRELRAAMADDFERYTAQAEELVALETGLRSLSGNARGRLTDRAGWIDANINSFQRLLRPIIDKLGVAASGPIAPVARRVAGAEMGMMLGWMSTRVLGQYDLLVIEEENPDDQDIVYYVAPNVLALERRYAFPTDEFRLWLSLHEVTHRAQFTGVPWMREHFLGLISSTMDSVDPDPKRLMAGLQRMLEARKRGEDPMADGGIMGLLANDDQREVLAQVSGLMSLLEGHGDTTMDRAGLDLIPSADRFSRVLHSRRQSSRGLTKVIQRITGLDAKMAQYAQGEAFIHAVEDSGGPELLDKAWYSPANLPTIEEIREPQLWVDRILSANVAA